jgi:hypothetical protein
VGFEEIQFEQAVHAGIAAVKGGERKQARAVVQSHRNKNHPIEPWLWLSATTDDIAEQRLPEHALQSIRATLPIAGTGAALAPAGSPRLLREERSQPRRPVGGACALELRPGKPSSAKAAAGR